jgi:hypothetical protein
LLEYKEGEDELDTSLVLEGHRDTALLHIWSVSRHASYSEEPAEEWNRVIKPLAGTMPFSEVETEVSWRDGDDQKPLPPPRQQIGGIEPLESSWSSQIDAR